MKKFMIGVLVCILAFISIGTNLVATPVHGETSQKTSSDVIVPPQIFKGTDETGQKLNYGDTVTLSLPLSPVTLYANKPGRWTVTGTGQSSTDTQRFTVQIPEQYAGYILQVTYTPADSQFRALNYKIQLDIPSQAGQAAPEKKVENLMGNMDIVTRANPQSSFQLDANDLASSTTMYTVYQDPIYAAWIATDSNHFRFGNRYGAEEGPGIWVVNRLIVDNNYLNYDHTALNLSKFGAGTYNVQYISQDNPQLSWSRQIRLYQGIADTNETCDTLENGPYTPNSPIYLVMKDDTYLKNGDSIQVTSKAQLSKFADVSLFADHVYQNGKKQIKRDGWSFFIPNVTWEYGPIGFGQYHWYTDASIASANRLEVMYNDEELLYELGDKLNGDDVDEGKKEFNIQEIIKRNGYKKGTYTININNDLLRKSCNVYGGKKSLETLEIPQLFTVNLRYE
ncbi:hypothetical protein ACQCN2_10000 [Brevibacillus ginsengisoli]|uniref:hypothetical protein n=1 Tax=Brevibacillus ginsengisoli TaxID=363854 RepID=UPI003CF2C33E